jgi:hypothetical protein
MKSLVNMLKTLENIVFQEFKIIAIFALEVVE